MRSSTLGADTASPITFGRRMKYPSSSSKSSFQHAELMGSRPAPLADGSGHWVEVHVAQLHCRVFSGPWDRCSGSR